MYVKNLDEQVDDDKLRQEFAVHGTISSARVMRDDKGASKGFAFVCYSTPEEAAKAVSEMNGKLVGAKPVYVALAQRKDARRAMLEAQFTSRMRQGMMPLYPQMFQGMNAMQGGGGMPGMMSGYFPQGSSAMGAPMAGGPGGQMPPYMNMRPPMMQRGPGGNMRPPMQGMYGGPMPQQMRGMPPRPG